jgi:hypothetical protein
MLKVTSKIANTEKPPSKPLFPIKLTVAGRPSVITPSLVVTLRRPVANVECAPDDADETRSDEGDFFADRAEQQMATEDGLLGDEEFDEDPDAMEALQEMLEDAQQAMEKLIEGQWDIDEEEDMESGVESDDGEARESQRDQCRVQGACALTTTTTTKKATHTQKTKKGNAKQGRSKPIPNYQFCPPAHRLAVIRLFVRHFCQHSLLPEWHGQPRTAQQIYRDAVSEMYFHCKRNHLRDVWAYLWVNWYHPNSWPLWA